MKLVTLNVAAFVTAAKREALRAFLADNQVYIALLQEVALPAFNLPGYDEVVNTGEQRRGTAVLARRELSMTPVVLLASGRGVSVQIADLRVVNLYAPAGSRFRSERALFYAEEVTPLLAAAGNSLLVGGDFNCVVRACDTTGAPNDCPQLSALLRGLNLTDAWTSLCSERGHTYSTRSMSSRLDRVYVAPDLASRLGSADVMPVSFSDHHAVLLSLAGAPAAKTPRPPAAWVLDRTILADENFKECFTREWQLWRSQRAGYPSAVQWWLRLVKPALRGLAAQYTKEKRRQQSELLSYLHATMHEVCSKQQRSPADLDILKDVKKAISEVHADRLQGVSIRAKLNNNVTDEPVSIHHVVKGKQRSKQQQLRVLETSAGEVLDAQDSIAAHLLDVFAAKFSAPTGPAPPPSALAHVERTVTAEDNEALTEDISEAELLAAVMASPKGKSPGPDGIVAELYRDMYDVIKDGLLEVVQEMWADCYVPEEMLRGVVVLIPKKDGGRSIKGLRPLTLLNCDVKILSRILTVRLARLSDKLLHPSQVRPGGLRNMAAALCDLRDVISYLHHYKYPGCILTIDLAAAFDSVRHDYLFQVLSQRGVAPGFTRVLQQLFANATAALRVNGTMTASFPIRRGVPQGGPPSALLFSVVLAPLVAAIHCRLQGARLSSSVLAVSAYADDMFAVLRTPNEAQAVREELDSFGAVSGLLPNHNKCGALPVATWDSSVDIGWAYAESVVVLGLTFGKTVAACSQLTWTRVLASVRGVLIDSSNRNLTLSQRVWFAATFGLSRAWHAAQVLPLSREAEKGLVSSLGRFIWRGSLFRVAMEVTTRPRSLGGLALPSVKLKSCALLTGRWHTMRELEPDGFTGEWVELLETLFPVGNPPNTAAVWAAAPHYQAYLTTGAYGCLRPGVTTCKALCRDVYERLLAADLAHRLPPRVARNWPATNWAQVWANVNSKALPQHVRDTWYECVHDIVPTRALLHARKVDRTLTSPDCQHCTVPDTLQHRLTECGDADAIWGWLQRLLKQLLGRDVEPDCLLRPDFRAGTRRQQAAAVWATGTMVAYLVGAEQAIAYKFIAHIKALKQNILESKKRWPGALVEGLTMFVK